MAIYNSSEITRGNGPEGRGPGVSVTYANGNINLASNTTLSSATTDTLPLVYIPYGSYISDFKLDLPAIDGGSALTLSLQDTLASPTTYISASTLGQGGGQLTSALFAIGTWGTMYGSTVRAQGANGNQVVVWSSGVQLILKVAHTATNTSGASALNIPFIIGFAPCYDMGT